MLTHRLFLQVEKFMQSRAVEASRAAASFRGNRDAINGYRVLEPNNSDYMKAYQVTLEKLINTELT